MSDTERDIHDLEMLLDKLLDGQLDKRGVNRLEALMTGEPERIKKYLIFLNLHIALEEQGAVLEEVRNRVKSDRLSDTEALEVDQKNESASQSPSSKTGLLAHGAVYSQLSNFITTPLLALIISVLVFYSFLWSNQVPTAQLVSSANAVWESEDSFNNFDLNQKHTLNAGFIILRFRSGAEVVIEGPSQFSVINGNAVALDTGRLVALCETKETHGFTVQVPQGRVVDLGTEFGVECINGGTTFTQVMNGEVQIFPRQADNEISYVIREGESILFDDQESLLRSHQKDLKFKRISELKKEIVFEAVNTNQ